MQNFPLKWRQSLLSLSDIVTGKIHACQSSISMTKRAETLPRASKLKQSKSSPLEYHEPLLRCVSHSLLWKLLGWLCLWFSLVDLFFSFGLFSDFPLEIILQDISFIHPTNTIVYSLYCYRLRGQSCEDDKVPSHKDLGNVRLGWGLSEETFEQIFVLRTYRMKFTTMGTVKVRR